MPKNPQINTESVTYLVMARKWGTDATLAVFLYLTIQKWVSIVLPSKHGIQTTKIPSLPTKMDK